jgi:NitT/TauT family transport system substrate-binding protein
MSKLDLYTKGGKIMRKGILFLLLNIFTISVIFTGCAKKETVYEIAWSHYTGWEPWDYADSSGILKKWADKYKIKIKLTRINDYIDSINLFTAKKYHGCTMTNMDALTIPAVGGIDSEVLIIGDFSNGNDGIITKSEKSVSDLKTKGPDKKKIKLVQFSVSHYLLSRALSMNKMNEKDVIVVNSSDADIGTLFISEKNGIAVTWNPILMQVAKEKGVKIIFDSSKIPGEIIDLMVVHADAPVALKKALTGAWYETMSVLSSKTKSAQAIAFMAKGSAATVPEFKAQLKTTAMFYAAKDAAIFSKTSKLKKTMDYVRTFSFNNGLYGQSGKSKDYVGILFPDGSIMGDKTNVKLIFTDKYMQMAADGKL